MPGSVAPCVFYGSYSPPVGFRRAASSSSTRSFYCFSFMLSGRLAPMLCFAVGLLIPRIFIIIDLTRTCFFRTVSSPVQLSRCVAMCMWTCLDAAMKSGMARCYCAQQLDDSHSASLTLESSTHTSLQVYISLRALSACSCH